MLLALLAFCGGALTILSPCILPVLPFVFARNGRSYARTTLPLLAGMAVTFAALASLGAVGGAWAVRVSSYGRIFALVLLALFGAALLSKRLADALTRPFVRLGNRLVESQGHEPGIGGSLLLGVATGFLWAPCAGPILGLILTGAAINGPGAQTSLLLFSYALGAIASLALATLAGRRVAVALRSSLGAGDWVRRILGVAVLAGVAAIALGWDTGILTRISLARTNELEQSLIKAIRPANMPRRGGPIEGEFPSLDGAVAWLNSPPLTSQGLRGKVVLIDFWTYSCINCLRTLPYLKAWQQRYKDHGLTIIGVHSPEFAFEKDERNVRRAVRELGVTYPVAMDNNFIIWNRFHNEYWPAHYFIDATGKVRAHHFGEGAYEEAEQTIRSLLTEAGYNNLPVAGGAMQGSAIESASDSGEVDSPETYVGYERAENFASPEMISRDAPADYSFPASLELNQWALAGRWTVSGESAMSGSPGGRITFQFRARDLHLVLAPDKPGANIRFRVTLDGKAPGEDRGADTDSEGAGTVSEQRLYQLIREKGRVGVHTFTIEFLDPGVHAYAFTFG